MLSVPSSAAFRPSATPPGGRWDDHRTQAYLYPSSWRINDHRRWAIAADHQFDLLITDIRLGDGSGLELLERLGRHGEVRAIAVSGLGAENDIERSRQAGFADHLIKPFAARKLHETIARIFVE